MPPPPSDRGSLYKCVNSFHVTGSKGLRAVAASAAAAAVAVADNTRETSDNGKALWSGLAGRAAAGMPPLPARACEIVCGAGGARAGVAAWVRESNDCKVRTAEEEEEEEEEKALHATRKKIHCTAHYSPVREKERKKEHSLGEVNARCRREIARRRWPPQIKE